MLPNRFQKYKLFPVKKLRKFKTYLTRLSCCWKQNNEPVTAKVAELTREDYDMPDFCPKYKMPDSLVWW